MTKRKLKQKNISARELALQALVQIEKGGAYSNLLLNQLFKTNSSLDPRERGLITELVYGTLQQQSLLDFYLQPFIKHDLQTLQDWVKQLLRLSIYQFIFLDRIPAHAIVNEAVDIAKILGHRGISGLVNGVLRNFLRSPRAKLDSIRDPLDRLAIETSHPSWLVKRWVQQFGLETTRLICQENNKPAKLTVRINSLKGSRTKIRQRLEEYGYTIEETTHSSVGLIVESAGEKVGTLPHSNLFKEGYITIQDESSMLVASLLNPEPGMKVLDACAAPGGKTTHLAELMQNKGEILAIDVHQHKEKLIQETSKRLGIEIIQTKTLDARHLPELYSQNGQVEAVFDRILLDAPCSGLGVIRRKPDLKWKKKPDDIERVSQLQYDLLSQISKLLKVNGYLVYSTCTLEATENELLIEKFLQNHPEFLQVPKSTKQIMPHHFGSDGFYMTKLLKSR